METDFQFPLTNFSKIMTYIQKLVILVSLISVPLFVWAAAPAAIDDLTCTPDISAGAIWLRWTVPSGVAGSPAYEVKYVQGNIIDYTSASTYSQNWTVGTAGLPQQELATGFNPGTQYTFAIKSQDGLGNWSEASNPTTCLAPIGHVDKIAPTSKIDTPSDKSILLIPPSITIKGSATDTGGSSIQKVEISLDGGENWILTTITESLDNKSNWEFVWERPGVGNYNLKTRATDWMNNVETVGAGINISIVSELPKVEEEKPFPPEKPISEMTVEELKTKIQEIQLKLIELITQLIQILQQQITLKT